MAVLLHMGLLFIQRPGVICIYFRKFYFKDACTNSFWLETNRIWERDNEPIHWSCEKFYKSYTIIGKIAERAGIYFSPSPTVSKEGTDNWIIGHNWIISIGVQSWRIIAVLMTYISCTLVQRRWHATPSHAKSGLVLYMSSMSLLSVIPHPTKQSLPHFFVITYCTILKNPWWMEKSLLKKDNCHWIFETLKITIENEIYRSIDIEISTEIRDNELKKN